MARRFSILGSWRRGKFSPLALAVALFLVVAAVFAASNCELGGMKAAGPGEHACCAETPGADPSAPAYSACCTAMVASLPVAVVVPALLPGELFSAWWPEVAFAGTADRATEATAAWAHDPSPPGTAFFFLELGLSRIRPAHAPPFVVA